MRAHVLPILTAVVLSLVPAAFAQTAVATSDGSRVLELDLVEQLTAERLFSEAEAAVWFPELGRVRWTEDDSAAGFAEAVENDYPGFRANAHGVYLLKLPARASAPAAAAAPLPVRPDAKIFADGFEDGLSNWNLDDNTLELYGWGTTTCEARTGTHSADATRGGVNTLSCSDPYAAGIVTTMTHKSCEGIAGASQAWLDVWIHVATESGHDTLGFFYDDAEGDGWGYTYSGTWNAWFHVALNLRQWFRVGDVTATSCPRLTVQFHSDASGQTGLGARIDDLAVSTGSPSFLSCQIGATPSSGAAPLTVAFTSTVSNKSSGTTTLWSFGDAAGSTATTSTATFTYTTPGTYYVRLRVADQGIYAYAHRTITVTGPAGGSKRRAVRSPGIADEQVASQTIGPAGGTISGGGVSVNFPAGACPYDTNVKVYKRLTAPDPNFDALQVMAAYEIDAGERHEFASDLTIRMKYDPALLRSDMPVDRAVSAGYWSPEQNAWVHLPATIDTTSKEIVVKTRHLTLFSWTMVKLGWSVFFKNNFYIVYDKAEVTDPNFLRWYRNPDQSNYADINVPNYVEDVMAFLIEAWRAYMTDRKFTAPPAPVDVYVGTDLSSFSEKLTGVVLISLTPQTPAELKLVTAHELFHRVQNAYYYDIGGMLFLKWWLEATADYAGDRVAWGGLGLMGTKIGHRYLEAPLTDSGDAHNEGYSTSHFVRYMVDHGADFKKMWDATANPSWFDSFSFLDGLTTYLMTVHGSSHGLNREYQQFARWFVFDPDSAMPAVTDSLHSEVAAYRSTLTGGGADATFDLAGGYTAKVWGVWFSEFLFDDDTPKRTYTVAVDGTLPTKVEADVYVLKKDQRVAGGGTPVGTLTQSTKSVEVEVEKGDAVYVLAVNADSSAQQVKLRIGSQEWKCWARFYVATYTEVYESGNAVCTGNCRVYDGSPDDGGFGDLFLGSVENDRFRGEEMWCADPPAWCRWRDGGAQYENVMEFQLTGNGAAVEGLHLRTSLLADGMTKPYVEELTASLSIPRVTSTPTKMQYKATGNICGSVSFARLNLTSYVCDGSSYIMLTCDAYVPPEP